MLNWAAYILVYLHGIELGWSLVSSDQSHIDFLFLADTSGHTHTQPMLRVCVYNILYTPFLAITHFDEGH